MKELIAYFDTQGCDITSSNQKLEQKRAAKALKLVGCTIAPFFERDVTIIVSRRPFVNGKQYPTNDIFHDAMNQRIKVWNYDKVFRFLKNLEPTNSAGTGGLTDASTSASTVPAASLVTGEQHHTELYNLLKEEKIFGNNDRDPNARRDDLHYLEKNYLYSYDLSQTLRPIAVREWYENAFPVLNLTLDGKCPFIVDSTSIAEQNLERRKLRRAQKFAATKSYRDLLKEATNRIINSAMGLKRGNFSSTSTSTDRTEDDQDYDVDEIGTEKENGKAKEKGNPDGEEDDQEAEQDEQEEQQNNDERTEDDLENINPLTTKYQFKAPPAPLFRQSSVMHANDSNSKYYEVAASGFNGASNAAQCSMDSTLNSNTISKMHVNENALVGNGLGPSVSQVPSKNINNLKRRIFMKKQKEGKKPSHKDHHSNANKDKELKPGYCENCRVKYDHFEDHILTNRHRNFACDDENFKDIDELISTLNESKSLGYVTSNGDYRYDYGGYNN